MLGRSSNRVLIILGARAPCWQSSRVGQYRVALLEKCRSHRSLLSTATRFCPALPAHPPAAPASRRSRRPLPSAWSKRSGAVTGRSTSLLSAARSHTETYGRVSSTVVCSRACWPRSSWSAASRAACACATWPLAPRMAPHRWRCAATRSLLCGKPPAERLCPVLPRYARPRARLQAQGGLQPQAPQPPSGVAYRPALLRRRAFFLTGSSTRGAPSARSTWPRTAPFLASALPLAPYPKPEPNPNVDQNYDRRRWPWEVNRTYRGPVPPAELSADAPPPIILLEFGVNGVSWVDVLLKRLRQVRA